MGIILLITLVIGGATWLCGKNVSHTNVTQSNLYATTHITQQQNNLTWQANTNQQSSDSSNSIENNGNTITVIMPQDWGNLIIPGLDRYGGVMNSPYGTVIIDAWGNKHYILLGGPVLNTESTKMISNYSYRDRAQYIVTPSITLATYPNTFADDDPNQGGWEAMTAKQKEADFQPLFDVFRQGNINNLEISQKCFLSTYYATSCANSNHLRGYWWNNYDGISDRVAVQYYANANSDLKGIGYFDVSGQSDPGMVEGYVVILINPIKRIMVHIYLPLEGIYNFPVKNTGNVSGSDFKKAYNYLENPPNYNPQLKQFMHDVQGIVSTIKIVF